jgi:hypothetical protein
MTTWGETCGPRPGPVAWEASERHGVGWSPPERPPVAVAAREFLSDFATPTSGGNLSTAAFPDALSPDPRVAVAYGPVASGDVSQGTAVVAWRAWVAGGSVLLAKEEAGGWGEPSELFSFSGEPLQWISLAFGGAGRPMVAAERPTGPGGSAEIWIYFFDPSVPGNTFQNFGAGRSPQAIHDDPYAAGGGDVQVFYAEPGGEVVHRQQVNRYLTAYPTPLNVGLTGRVARVARGGGRLSVWGAMRDLPSGRWSLVRVDSQPFPYYSGEGVALSPSPLGASLLESPSFFPEGVTLVGFPGAVELRDVVAVSVSTEASSLTASPVGGQLLTVVVVSPSVEATTLAAHPTGAQLLNVVILHPSVEPVTLTAAPTGGQLESV